MCFDGASVLREIAVVSVGRAGLATTAGHVSPRRLRICPERTKVQQGRCCRSSAGQSPAIQRSTSSSMRMPMPFSGM